MRFDPPLLEGRLLRRYKRFFADVELACGDIVTAHCANTGSMAGLLEAGNPVWIKKADNPDRKLAYDWVQVEVGSARVGVHTNYANGIVEQALASGHIPGLAGFDSVRREVKYGAGSRIDFLLESGGRRPCYVEVKNVTLSRQKGLAEFPDARTTRGTKHLYELKAMVENGARAMMLYLVQRDDCYRFSIAADIDLNYAEAFRTAYDSGVEAMACACTLSPEEIRMSHLIPVEV